MFSDRLHGPGTFRVEVLAKSLDAHNLDLIWEATSNQWEHRESPEGDFWERVTDAQMISEEGHSHDRHEIAVNIAGRKIGILSLADALKFHRRLHQLRYDRIDSLCKAMITGRQGWWEVKLDIVDKLVDQPKQETG